MNTRNRRNLALALVAALAMGGLAAVSPSAAFAVDCPSVAAGTGAVTPAPSAGVDWNGCDLTGADLQGANLDGAILDGATLTDANLNFADAPQASFIGTHFDGARMRGFNGYLTDFTNADFTGADLRDFNFNTATVATATLVDVRMAEANVSKADFTGSSFDNIASGGITGYTSNPLPVFPAGWSVIDGILVNPSTDCPTVDPGTGVVHDPDPAPSVNWSTCDLTGANLSGQDLAGAQFVNATMTDANLVSANIINANFTGANLLRLALAAATGTGAAFNYATGGQWGALGATLNESDFDHANVAYSQLQDATIHDANFNYGTLVGSTLDSAEFNNSTFAYTLLSTANIDRTNFTGATFALVRAIGLTGGGSGNEPTLPTDWKLVSGFLLGPTVDLHIADLTGVDLTNVNLTGSILTDAILTDTNVNGLDLTGCSLTGLISGGVTGTPAALPTDWQLAGSYLLGPEANLANASLAGVNLDGVNVSGADLTGADLSGSTLSRANLEGTLLTNANLASADLTNARLANSDIDGAGLRRATLTGVQSGQITGTPSSLPAGWHLTGGFLLGQGANLSYADLSDQNLSNYNLTDANLSHANLDSANLANSLLIAADLSFAQAGDANFVRANLDGANLFSTSFAYSDLASSILTAVDASGVDFTHANLTYTNARDGDFPDSIMVDSNVEYASFYGADLSRADLTGMQNLSTANVSSVTWKDTTCPDGSSSKAHNSGSCANPIDATAPSASVTSPTSTFQTGQSIGVTWTGSDDGSGIDFYDVQYQTMSSLGGTATSWTTWKSGTSATSGTLNTSSLSQSLGTRYCFRVIAHNGAGLTKTSSSKCTNIAFDERSLSKSSGWSRYSSSSYLASTYSDSKSSGAYLITGTKSGLLHISVVAYRCSSCGSIAIYVGSTKVGSYSLAKSGSGTRSVINVPRFSSAKSGKVKIVVAKSGKTVRLDGVGLTAY